MAGHAGAVAVAVPALSLLLAAGFARLHRRLQPQARLRARLHETLGLSPPGQAGGSLLTRLARYEGALAGGEADRQEIVTLLRAAGFYAPDAAMAFALLRIGATLGTFAAALAVRLAWHWPGGRVWLMPTALAVTSFLLAKRALHVLAARRQRRVRGELPFLLDLVRLMLESGSSLDQCLRMLARPVAAAAVPQTSAAFRALVDDLQNGAPYEQALGRWADRLGVAAARDLAAIFRQSLLHGSDITERLAAQAQDAAEQRLATAREAVGRKAAQLSGAMMLFFMPALFILLGGPAAAGLSEALKGLTR